MRFNRAGQKLCVSSAFYVTSIVELGFAGNTPDHHRLHKHKSRPWMANAVKQMSKIWTGASQNVLIEDKKRLDGSNHSLRVLQYKIQIFELGMDRIVYQIVITMIFVL